MVGEEEIPARAAATLTGLREKRGVPTDEVVARIAAAIREAIAEEREACAQIADDEADAAYVPYDPIPRLACEAIAEKIRARGEPP